MKISMPSEIFRHLSTPLGEMILAMRADAQEQGPALSGAWFVGQRHFDGPAPHWIADERHPLLREAAAQILDWHGGRRQHFSLPIAPQGSAFQQQVWRALAEIPFGTTRTYGELAAALGRPAAARAVGAATGRNPLSLIVPCHRLVGRDGALTGYAGGLERKRALLDFERQRGHRPDA